MLGCLWYQIKMTFRWFGIIISLGRERRVRSASVDRYVVLCTVQCLYYTFRTQFDQLRVPWSIHFLLHLVLVVSLTSIYTISHLAYCFVSRPKTFENLPGTKPKNDCFLVFLVGNNEMAQWSNGVALVQYSIAIGHRQFYGWFGTLWCNISKYVSHYACGQLLKN